ncbi:hypothetical protein JCM10207_007027 [Rhodosporidiobolus poonsookiae]
MASRVRKSPYFVPGAVMVVAILLALFYSAIRLASHQSDTYAVSYDAPAAPLQATSRTSVDKVSPTSPSTPPRPSNSASSDDQRRTPHQALDDAVRHALEEAWHLPPHGQHVGEGDAAGAGELAEGGADAAAPQATQRTLQELYADLEELGISAHELQEALEDGMRDAGERA